MAVIDRTVQVAQVPQPGMGVPLDVNGKLPQSVQQTLPGYEFAYKEFTANVTISATTAATANTIVTAPTVTFDGFTSVKVEFFCSDLFVAANAAGNACVLTLYVDGAQAGFLGQQSTGGTGFLDCLVIAEQRLTPTAGAHSYSVRGYRSNANCTAQAGAGGSGAFVPGYIRITRA